MRSPGGTAATSSTPVGVAVYTSVTIIAAVVLVACVAVASDWPAASSFTLFPAHVVVAEMTVDGFVLVVVVAVVVACVVVGVVVAIVHLAVPANACASVA